MVDQGVPRAPEVQNKSNLCTIISAAVGLGLLTLLTIAFLSADNGHPRQGDPAPDFSLTLLDGSEVSLSDLRGHVVVLNFWASWCSPCRTEAPVLQRAWETYKDRGVLFLGTSYHDAGGASQAFIEEFGITYPNGVDLRGRISRAYAVTGVPETFIIDRDGRVAWFLIGEVQADALARQLEQLLNE